MRSSDSLAQPHSRHLALDVAIEASELLQLRLLKVIMQASKGLEKKAVKLLSLEASAQAKASQAEARLEAKAAAKRKRQEEKQAEKAQLKRCLMCTVHHMLTRTVHVVHGPSLLVESTQSNAVCAKPWSTTRFYAAEQEHECTPEVSATRCLSFVSGIAQHSLAKGWLLQVSHETFLQQHNIAQTVRFCGVDELP